MNVYEFDAYMNKIKHISNKNLIQIYKDLDISRFEFKLLMTLYYSDELLTASILASLFDVTVAAVMHRMQVLEDKNLVRKEASKEDQRIKYYYLTDEAYRICTEKAIMIEKKTTKFLESLGDDVDVLEGILVKIINYMEESK